MLKIFITPDENTRSENVPLFPSLDTLPSEVLKPSEYLQSVRISILEKLIFSELKNIIIPIKSLMTPVSKNNNFNKITIKENNTYNFDTLVKEFVQLGYKRVPVVQERGDFCVRGGIIDVFPPLDSNAVRIDFFGNKVDQIKRFFIDTQLSFSKIESVKIMPCFEKKGDSFLYELLPSKNETVFINSELIKKNAKTLKNLDDKFYDYQFIINNINDIQHVSSYSGFNKSNNIYDFQNVKQKREKYHKSQSHNLILNEGDYVVHKINGIGKFLGIETKKLTKEIDGQTLKIEKEFISLEYANDSRLYVPVDNTNQISKYIGGTNPKIDTLGTGLWRKRVKKASKNANQISYELIKLYQKRNETIGFSFKKDTQMQKELENSFEWVETNDQLKAISDIKNDMESKKPMDRIVAGDVGFGKTEIALRAAFKAVSSNKQVALLSPTTILSRQHFQTFKNRLKKFPIVVKELSRWISSSEKKELVSKLASGEIDILIGTHAILGTKFKFKDLGLIIIDEEQRFGVEQKETLKAISPNADILSLSATPIPRTLEMGLVGIRDMSILKTPPENRIPIRTYIGPIDYKAITTVIKNEKLRGGQVFLICNNISKIDKEVSKIRKLLNDKNIKISTAHAKMDSKTLSNTQKKFWDNKIDVLVCTTIIENGLDVQNANTIIALDSQSFGLSQMHQLRGRIGRQGQKQGYAYFFYPEKFVPSETAIKRLETILKNSNLGDGSKIALKDLEIRGAGNLLGKNQSGHIELIGFDLYIKLINQSITNLKRISKGESDNLLDIFSDDISVNLPISTKIPDDYIDDKELRLEIYEKIASAKNSDDYKNIIAELVDRFGKTPDEIDNLIVLNRIKNKGLQKNLKEITVKGKYLSFYPVEKNIPNNAIYKPVTKIALLPIKNTSVKSQEKQINDFIDGI